MTFHYKISTPGMLALSVLGVLGALTMTACQTGGGGGQDFVSDDPNATWGGDDGAGETGGGEDGGDSGDGDNGGEGGEEVVSEADIIQVEGDLLYALSTYSGLSVVDMQNPDDLDVLGTWETDAQPFEMYVESGQAFVMFNDFGFWDWDAEFDEWSYNSSSRLVALDATDPGAIEVKGEFTLPGRIQDSRRVGDVLYLVTMEDGYCWDCDEVQKTVVTSLDISDEANPQIVDQLAFPSLDNNWDWQRSVESTADRMYIAARTWAWEGLGSTIDVVDISAHDGSLVAGDQVVVTGSVFSRWQMNEHEGVLRVISQLGWTDNPVIETFTIETAQSLVALGTGSLQLPEPESLRSARFDGDRAYAITAEQTDPLFTIDLSDPANPKQQGELEIPGWVYHMETRGDRVLALGFDPGHPDGSVNVSLFDVSAFDQPMLRRRVHFGGDWASFPEDQNRIHKAFSILDDEQMLLVPHTGWDQVEEGFECWNGSYRGGVQIIDWLDDDLTLRGLVPARGQPRRAFTHRERIMTVSDVELASFDYSDRDNPVAQDELALAVFVDDLVDAGEVWVRMGRDWYTDEQVIEIVSAADPGAPEPLGSLALAPAEDCEYAWVEGLYAHEDHVFVVQTVYRETWDQDQYDFKSYARVISVDISDPSAPLIDDMFELDGERSYGSSYVAGVSTGSSWVVHQGDSLAFLVRDVETQVESVEVVDLSDPGALELAASLARPAGQTQGELTQMSDTIVSWHTEPVPNQPGKVRFYFDRLDLDGSPAWAPKVNVPGIIVGYDADNGRAYTVDFHISEAANLSADACYEHPKFWRYEDGACKLIERSLEQLIVVGDGAMLVDSIDIEGDAGLEQLRATGERIFAKTDKSHWDQNQDQWVEDSDLVIVDIANFAAQVHSVEGEVFGRWWSLAGVEGERAVVRSGYGELGLVNAADVANPDIQMSEVPGYGCYNAILDGDTVYCPMGAYGLETVSW